ncbi:MAG: glutathione S-transferase family protein [Hyphomicrobiales bacterium]
MEVYHHPMSSGSRIVRMAIGEYGASAEYFVERTWERREAFLLLNPEGTLPVLVDEGEVPICGAITTCEYLDETRGFTLEDRRLMPSHPLARAEVRRLMHWFLVKMEAEATQYFVNEKVTKREKPRDAGGGAPESAVLRIARANLRNHLAYLEYLASERNWLGGDQMSYADFAAAAAISVIDYLNEMPWSDHEAAKTWYTRIKCRPAFREILADKMRGIPPPAHYTDLDF